jgi:hypothetical protein
MFEQQRHRKIFIPVVAFLINIRDQVFRLHFIAANQAEVDYILSSIEFNN